MSKKWTREEVVRLFEILIERESLLVSHPKFRALLNRDENLLTNQVIRESNGNIAYRSVDFDILTCEDEAFWDRIDNTPYSDLIQNNAATAMVKMAEKFKLLSE